MSAPDPYGTEALRARVLRAWADSPARFREDANAEEDLARGGYRDRVLVELAQNAADAAARAGVPGRLLLQLTGDVLVAANTGAPLDAAGVEALSTLRASAKRETPEAVGRFGVGFAAVRAVADEVCVRSWPGAVRWSLAATRAAVAALPSLAEELARRGSALPVLRLPFAAAAEGDAGVDAGAGVGAGVEPVPAGYDTAVVLRLRDAAAVEQVRGLLAGLDDALLLTLPGLTEVVVEDGAGQRRLVADRGDGVVVVHDDGRQTRWRQVSASGSLPPELLADRPVEERERPTWSVTVAVPVDAAGLPVDPPDSVPRVLHAPTPTDEPVSLRALVVASVPLEPSRRRSVEGPLRDAVLGHAATAYAELVAGLPSDPRLLDLVPGPLPSGPVDATLAAAVLYRLRSSAWLPGATDGTRLRPDAAVTVPAARSAADPAALAQLVAGLVDPAWWGRPALRRLGVTELDLAEVVDALAGARWEPARWRALYAALDGADREALAALPVPLVDGRVVRGPRGVLVARDLPPGAAETLGLRVVHPDATHPLLLRLGAAEATPAAVLADPAVAAAVTASGPEDDLEALADAVLGLVAASTASVDELPWLAELPLRDAEGEPAPAGELVLPGSAAERVLDPEAVLPVAADLVDRWGADTLARAGVLASLALVRDADVPLDGTADHDLDDEQGWLEAISAGAADDPVPPVLAELVAVRDLDLVRKGAWPEVLPMLSADPGLREAVLGPAWVVDAWGHRRAVPTYTAWWLREHARLAGRPLRVLRVRDADPALAGLYDVVDLPGVDAEILDAVGVVTTLERLVQHPGWADDLLARLADPARQLAAAALHRLVRLLASADPQTVAAVDRVRVPDGAGTTVVAAADVVVIDAPMWTQIGLPAVLPAPTDLARQVADVLDLPLAAEVVPAAAPEGEGVTVPVPAVVRQVLPDAPETYVEHDDLVVAGRSVEWWVDTTGAVHAATSDGLARGLAWATGRWEIRLLVAEVLRDPQRVTELVAETAWQDR